MKAVTPQDARDWCDLIRHEFAAVDLNETMSGSGWLTLTAYASGMLVSLPRDYRYGWDLKVAEHRHFVDEITALLPEKVELYSPKCTSWSLSLSLSLSLPLSLSLTQSRLRQS